MGRLDEIQTTLKPFEKIGENRNTIIMIILELAEAFKTMIQPDPSRPDRNTL